MFLISWCLAHWKLVAAAVLAIAFFSRRAQSLPPQTEAADKNMNHPASSATPATEAGSAPPPPPHAEADASATSASPTGAADGAAAAPEASLDPIFDEITGLFASRNPKHALQGLTDGLRNTVTGVGLGLAGTVAGTYGGAKEGGWRGMAKGFGMGVAAFVPLTGYGIYTGARQLVRGLGNTPSAVSEVHKGEAYWDSNAQAWVRVNLAADMEGLPPTDEDVLAEARKAHAQAEKDGTLPMAPLSATPDGTDGKEADTATAPSGESAAAEQPVNYYAFLGVDATASTSDIRKAYTRKALEMHPDKNPNDPNATLKFQELNKIYNVLSHEDTRATYDRHGTVDPANIPEMVGNPMKDLLGATFLDPLVGPLHFYLVFEGGVLFSSEMQSALYARRRLRVAKNLVTWLDYGEAGFDAAQLVLRDAVSTALGPIFLTYVAEEYHVASRQQLYGSSWQREMDSFYSSWATTASSLWHWTTMGASTVRRAFVSKNLGEEDILRVLAVANESDVRKTVLQACRLVLLDLSVTPEQRRQRAVRLEELSARVMEEVAREVASRESAAAIAASEAAAAADGESGTSPGAKATTTDSCPPAS